MTNIFIVITALLTFLVIFFLFALWGEKLTAKGKNPANNKYIYSLSLAVYTTTWTFYGSIGSAIEQGPLFLAIYLGPTLAAFLCFTLLRRLIRLKDRYGLTNIADLLSVRHNNSQLLGGLVALCCIIAIVPYIAMQLKAIRTTYYLVTLTNPDPSGFDFIGLGVTLLMIIFVILFGLRRLDATKRHQGMVLAVTFESVFKLFAFLVAGIFIVFVVFQGFEDINAKSQQNLAPVFSHDRNWPFATWISYLILGASAFILLPRQFHMAVVENSNPRHVFTAMWVLPLYLLLINIFVYPISRAGLLLGFRNGDTFLLVIPLLKEYPIIALLVFIGGFAAATSMMTVSSVALATMTTNHLYLPIINFFNLIKLKGKLLFARWATVVIIFGAAYLFDLLIGKSHSLVFLGTLSFVAVYQFLPATLGAIYWKNGNRIGAICGIIAGFTVWTYSLLLPALAEAGILPSHFIFQNPFGIDFLKPTALFGMEGIDRVSHCVFWSTLLNSFFYIFLSLLFGPTEDELLAGNNFSKILHKNRDSQTQNSQSSTVDLEIKLPIIRSSLRQYFSHNRAEEIIIECFTRMDIDPSEKTLALMSFTELTTNLEKFIAGSIGTTAAHHCLPNSNLFSGNEKKELASLYGEILTNLRLSPSDLHKKLNYLQERENLLAHHAKELQEQIDAFEKEMQNRIKAEQELRTSEELYKHLLNALPAGVVIHTQGKIQFANNTARKLLKYDITEQSIIDQNIIDLIQKEDKPLVLERLQLLDTGKTFLPITEIRYIKKDNTTLYTQTVSVLTQYKRIASVVTIFVDLTEIRETMEAKLLLSSAVEQTADLVLVITDEGLIRYANPSFYQKTGLHAENIIGHHIKVLSTGPLLSLFEQVYTRKKPQQEKLQLVTANSETTIETELTMSPIIDHDKVTHVVSIFHDLTKQRSLEKQLYQSQKMEAVGTMAGGIAHDFNNLLFIILGNIDLALLKTNDNTFLQNKLNSMKEAGQRAKELVSKILTFSRYSDSNREMLDIYPTVEKTVAKVQSSISDTITLSIHNNLNSICHVYADPLEIDQIITNLCINSSQAMEENGGVIEITVSQIDTSDKFLQNQQGNKDQEFIRISVRDTGKGIEKENIDRVFEPFYTTKPIGKGTGLGLAIVHTLVKDLNGSIVVESSENVETLFHVMLPKKTAIETVRSAQVIPQKTEPKHILLVDDEPAIIELMATMFDSLGYSYSSFESSLLALKAFKNNPDAFDLVFTDQTMPNLTGTEMAEKILLLRPDIPIILCSGYSQSISPDEATEKGILAFLKKPLLFDDVKEVVHSALYSKTTH